MFGFEIYFLPGLDLSVASRIIVDQKFFLVNTEFFGYGRVIVARECYDIMKAPAATHLMRRQESGEYEVAVFFRKTSRLCVEKIEGIGFFYGTLCIVGVGGVSAFAQCDGPCLIVGRIKIEERGITFPEEKTGMVGERFSRSGIGAETFVGRVVRT